MLNTNITVFYLCLALYSVDKRLVFIHLYPIFVTKNPVSYIAFIKKTVPSKNSGYYVSSLQCFIISLVFRGRPRIFSVLLYFSSSEEDHMSSAFYYISRLPSIAFKRVTSSAYSISPPIGIP